MLAGTIRVNCENCLRDSSKPIHRPSVYFIDLVLPMNFKNRTSAQASLAAAALLKFARKTI